MPLHRRSSRLCGIAASALVTLLCSACTVVGHIRTTDWPSLSVTESKVDVATMMEHCSRYTNVLTWPPLACSEFDLTARTCRIWYVWDIHLEHERLHCAGYDHIGGSTMREAVAILRAAQVAAVAGASGTGASTAGEKSR